MGIWTAIAGFVNDDRGAESVEFAIVSLVVAAGSVQGMLRVQAALDGKVDAAVSQIELAE